MDKLHICGINIMRYGVILCFTFTREKASRDEEPLLFGLIVSQGNLFERVQHLRKKQVLERGRGVYFGQ